jgi:Myb-like DNA-binding domain
MTTLLTPPRTGASASYYTNYSSPHYPAMESGRTSYCPSTPSSSERREHERLNSSGVVSPVTPTQRAVRTPPASISTPSAASSSTRADAATYHVLASSASPPTPRPIKGPWTPSEDRLLLSLVNELGAEKWVVIASRLGTRTGKQCRERWHNHVNPILNKAPFSLEEEEAIERYYAEIGPKWAEIAKKLPGRSMSPTF